MLIGFGYQMHVGKDLAAEYLCHRYEFTRKAFADPLKRACKEIFGFSNAQLYGVEKEIVDEFWGRTPREVLQRVGTDCLREKFSNDIWINAIEREVKDTRRCVVSDVRFLNEVAAIKRWGGKVIRIVRPEVESRQAHVSENCLNNFKGWDYTIYNTFTIEEFYKKLDHLMEILCQ